MVFVNQFEAGDVDLYADVLASVAGALAVQDVNSARERLGAIFGWLWNGKVSATRTIASEFASKTPRAVRDKARAQVFLRDGFRCSYCGGRGLPRCVMVGIGDVFPEEFAYHAHYSRGRNHPAYGLLALEADHTVPHARGGPGEEGNLAAMHALCNTKKSAADLDEVAGIERLEARDSWRGLLPEYPGVVLSRNSHGSRHSSLNYHRDWLRRFDLTPIGDEIDPAAGG